VGQVAKLPIVSPTGANSTDNNVGQQLVSTTANMTESSMSQASVMMRRRMQQLLWRALFFVLTCRLVLLSPVAHVALLVRHLAVT
jgi:hypothetical protein